MCSTHYKTSDVLLCVAHIHSEPDIRLVLYEYYTQQDITGLISYTDSKTWLVLLCTTHSKTSLVLSDTRHSKTWCLIWVLNTASHWSYMSTRHSKTSLVLYEYYTQQDIAGLIWALHAARHHWSYLSTTHSKTWCLAVCSTHSKTDWS